MMTFPEFMRKVDACLMTKVGFPSNSIADAPWREYYEDELEIEAACAYALCDYNDVDFDLLESVGLGEWI